MIAAANRPATIAIASGLIRTPLTAKRLMSVKSTAEEIRAMIPLLTDRLPGVKLPESESLWRGNCV
jgi:hypothetical protein